MDKKLEKKINLLFEYRVFPELFAEAGEKYKNHKLVKNLKELQAAIYHLDHHLETNWDINAKKDLKPYWKEIYAALTKCGIKKADHDDYCKLIYKYQKHELYLRENRLPIDFKMEFYYYFKSCDVKLLRRIICDHFPILAKLYPTAHWRWFDLITEVNDDVEDVFEDMTTINGNYFLIEYLRSNPKLAKAKFAKFIKYIEDKSKSRKEKYSNSYKWCDKLTQRECKATKSLLNKNTKLVLASKKKVKIAALIK